MRGAIAVAVQLFLVSGIVAQIVEVGAEVGQELAIDYGFFLPPINFTEPFGIVECNFRLRSLHRKTRIPDAPVGRIEAAAVRLRVRESGRPGGRV